MGNGTALSKMKKSWQLYVLLSLPVLYLIIFKYWPMLGAQIAFRKYIVTKGIWGSPWVGLTNFVQFIQSYDFWAVLRNTLTLSVYNLLAGFPFPILLALSLNYVGNRFFKKTVQTITYAPHFISVVVIVGIVLEMLDPHTGIVNTLSTALGMKPVNYMGNPAYFKSIYVWSDIWQNVGFNCIIYLAVLTSVDPQLHEAAIMDGASKWRRIWNIDLPGVMPIAVIMMILAVGHVLDTGFQKVLLLQNPLNLSTSEVLDTYVYKVGLASSFPQFSYATAIGLFKSLIGFAMVLSVNKLAKVFGQESLW